jgi:hypothetical protein
MDYPVRLAVDVRHQSCCADPGPCQCGFGRGKAARSAIAAPSVLPMLPLNRSASCSLMHIGQRAVYGLRNLAEATVEHLLDGGDAHRFVLGLVSK